MLANQGRELASWLTIHVVQLWVADKEVSLVLVVCSKTINQEVLIRNAQYTTNGSVSSSSD